MKINIVSLCGYVFSFIHVMKTLFLSACVLIIGLLRFILGERVISCLEIERSMRACYDVDHEN